MKKITASIVILFLVLSPLSSLAGQNSNGSNSAYASASSSSSSNANSSASSSSSNEGTTSSASTETNTSTFTETYTETVGNAEASSNASAIALASADASATSSTDNSDSVAIASSESSSESYSESYAKGKKGGWTKEHKHHDHDGDDYHDEDNDSDQNNSDIPPSNNNGSGSNQIPLPQNPSCEEIKSASGWFAKYYDYSASHPDMEMPTDWSKSFGDPLSSVSSWTTDWYNSSYFKFSRIDSNLEFGDNFFPLDFISGAEITNGHNYHFGAVWSGKVVVPVSGEYEYSLISDDDTWVYINGLLVVDNSSVHPPTSKSGSVSLNSGSNIINIYFAERHTVQSYMYFKFLDSSLAVKPYNSDCNPQTQDYGQIVIRKQTKFGDDTFAFESDLENFEISTSNIGGIKGFGSKTFNNALVGEYVVSEVQKNGWEIESIVCLDATSDTTIGASSVNIKLSKGETVMCTFTNVKVSTPTPDPVPTVTLVANPSSINSGATSTLSWNSTNTISCSAIWTSGNSTSGSFDIDPSTTTEYGITCTGHYGTVSASTTVTVNIETPPNNNGGGNGGSGVVSGSNTGGGSGSLSGRRRDVSSLLTPYVDGIGGMGECSYLRDYLRRDWNNDSVEVMKLQSFLNIFENESLAVSGVFDEDTFAATSRFQNKYKSDILTPWGHTAPTGFVYILTKKKINEIYCNMTIALTSEQRSEIEAFRSYLQNLPVSGTPMIDNKPIDLSDYVGMEENNAKSIGLSISGIATSVKENFASTTDSILSNNTLRSLATSLFGAPKGLKEISSTYLLILVGLVLIAAFAPRRDQTGSITVLETSKKENKKEKSHIEAELSPTPVIDALPNSSEFAPKAEDFEDPAPTSTHTPIAMGPDSLKKDEDKDKGFKGIIG